jgi:predicted dinucleotide-binding enzyme
MRYGVLGTGMVGQTLATRLTELGHDVMMGSRTADNRDAEAWRQRTGVRGRVG